MRRLVIATAVVVTLALGGCGSERPTPPPRPRGSAPLTLTAPPSAATRQCFADLFRQNVRYSPLPDRDYGGGCHVTGAVQLIDYGVPTTNLTAMACPLSRTFIAWVRNGVSPAARELLGSEVVRVDSFGTYACRNVVGSANASTRLSEHASANAVDVAGFMLSDGRRITIANDWRSADPAVQGFLQAIHTSACRRFGTVLSPDYNAAHHDHLHLDMGRGPFCR